MRKKSQTHNIVEHLTTIYEDYVSFNDADPLGIVWHGNYIKYFEKGREEFGRQHGLDYPLFYKNQFSAPIVDLKCSYKASLKPGDYYKIRTTIVNTAVAKIILQFQIFSENGNLVCEGETTQAFVDSEGEMALYPPKFYEDWKQKVNFK